MAEVQLASNQYGKAENRVVRSDPRHPGMRSPTSTSTSAAARRLRGRAHRGRQLSCSGDRHAEEHHLRVRQGRHSFSEEFLLRLADHFTSEFDWVSGAAGRPISTGGPASMITTTPSTGARPRSGPRC